MAKQVIGSNYRRAIFEVSIASGDHEKLLKLHKANHREFAEVSSFVKFSALPEQVQVDLYEEIALGPLEPKLNSSEVQGTTVEIRRQDNDNTWRFDV